MRNKTVMLYDEAYPSCQEQRRARMALWERGAESIEVPWSYYSQNKTNESFVDVIVSWGKRKAHEIHNKCFYHVVMEQGFLGSRTQNFYVGFNDLNGMGAPITGVRLGAGRKWYGDLAPSRESNTPHRRAVFMAQVPGDSNLSCFGKTEKEQIKNYKDWCVRVLNLLFSHGYEVGFKGHPFDPILYNWVRNNLTSVICFDDLISAFAWADTAVAFNSNSLVDAAIAGLAVCPAQHGSLTWPIASKIGGPHSSPNEEVRCQWLDYVATFQWPQEMIANGTVLQTILNSF